MFSGLGSISDLNQQFAQFTSNLTNLDSLQDGSNPIPATAKTGHATSDDQSSTMRSLELANEKLTEELSCQQSLMNDLKAYLSVKDDQLTSKDAEIVFLAKELNQAIELEQVATKSLSEYRQQTEEKLKALTEDLADRQSPKKRVDKITQSNELKVASRKIEELERRLAEALFARPAGSEESQSGVSEDSSHALALEESRRAAELAHQQVQELKEQLTAVEKDIISQKTKYSSELDNANQCIEQLRSDLLTSSASATSQIAELQVQLSEKTGTLEKLEVDLQAYLNNIVELNEEKSLLLDRIARAESRCVELEASLRATQASVSSLEHQNTHTSNAASDEVAQLRDLADTRMRLLQEAEGKVSTLTEKLKDMMHRFAELKAKSTGQNQQLEERLADITKLAQAKDSEILGLRLKMENAERSGSDTRLKVSELAERYGEAQREITRLRSVVEERLAETVILTEQRDQGTVALSSCEAQRDDLAQRLHMLEEQAATQADSHERSLRELKAELTAQKGVAEEQLAQLRAEVEAAQGRLRVEEDSAGNLDNYKKRAQLALKKANAANATLSAEVQQLQAALDETTARLTEAQTAVKVANEELVAARDAVQSLRADHLSLESTLAEALALSSAKEQEYTGRLSDLQQELSAERGRSLQRKEHDGRAAGATRLVRGDDGGGEETAANAMGRKVQAAAASSDLQPLSLSPSYPTDSDVAASQDGGSSINGDSDSFSNNNKSLGGSSWAMVAASESRLTSTHPSTASLLADDDGAAHPQQQQQQQQKPQHLATATLVTGNGGDGDDEPSDFRATPLSSDSLLFINQLQNQLEAVRKDLSRRGIDLEAAHQQLQYEKDEKRVLKNRVEELLAYLERTKQLREGPDSAINMEYLKNCVFKFMSSTDLSEKRRLYPVIATILKLTSQEMREIEVAFQATEERENEFQNTISSIGSFAASSFGSLWGSASS